MVPWVKVVPWGAETKLLTSCCLPQSFIQQTSPRHAQHAISSLETGVQHQESQRKQPSSRQPYRYAFSIQNISANRKIAVVWTEMPHYHTGSHWKTFQISSCYLSSVWNCQACCTRDSQGGLWTLRVGHSAGMSQDASGSSTACRSSFCNFTNGCG